MTQNAEEPEGGAFKERLSDEDAGDWGQASFLGTRMS
jgi:hypothetical protein